MSDLETRLSDHFAARTSDLPTTGPGLDHVGSTSATLAPIRRPRYGTISLIAAASIVVLGLGGLFLIGRDDGDSLSTAETGPSTNEAVFNEDELQPVETLPDAGDASESPVTVASGQPGSWYGFAPDLDIAWYSDQVRPSMFCWLTPAVPDAQCFVDPLGATIVPLVVPTAGGQTLVLAGGEKSDATLTVTLDDGSILSASQDFDDIIDWGVARFALAPGRSIVEVDGRPVVPPSTLDEYIPPFLLDFIGFDLADFTEQAAAIGFTTRVTSQDGEPLDVLANYDVDRINVATVDGKVTELFPIG